MVEHPSAHIVSIECPNAQMQSAQMGQSFGSSKGVSKEIPSVSLLIPPDTPLMFSGGIKRDQWYEMG